MSTSRPSRPRRVGSFAARQCRLMGGAAVGSEWRRRSAVSIPKLRAHLAGPGPRIEAVRLDQGERDALQAETEAGGVRDRFVRVTDAELRTEVILVPVERTDRGGFFLRDHR